MIGPTTLFYHTPDGLVPFGTEPFPSEDALQRLLATHPIILERALGGRCLPISRETGVPDETGSQRWSVDPVFIDHAGIPTLVEVKPQEDSRIRREMIGQMFRLSGQRASVLVRGPS